MAESRGVRSGGLTSGCAESEFVKDPPGVGDLRAGDEQDPLDMCGKRQSRLHGLLRCLDRGQAAFCDGQVWDHVIVGPSRVGDAGTLPRPRR